MSSLSLPAQFVRHVCPAGGKDYAPGHPGGTSAPHAGYTLRLTIGSDDWYDPTPLGRDAKDWLKAAGVSYFNWFSPGSWPKNHRSALVGFRMLPEERWQVCAYVNDAEGGFTYDGVLTLAAGDTVTVTYRYLDGAAVYSLAAGKQQVAARFENFVRGSREVNVGPWHGGSLSAPVGTGLGAEFVLE